MPLRNLKQFVEECYDAGNNWTSSVRKVPAIASSTGIWSDLSGAPGNPKPNYYVGAERVGTTFDTSRTVDPDVGIWHGGNVAPKTKHLHRALIGTNGAGMTGSFLLCDYLMFYPLIDMDSTDFQTLDNPVSLPRYSDGLGVKMFLVATNPFIGGASFSVTYIDADDVERQSQFILTNTSTQIGSVLNSGVSASLAGPFVPLSGGVRGIKRATGIQFFSPNGGLASLVLVKPITTLFINEVSAMAEWDLLTTKPSLPQIKDGAYLSFLGMTSVSWAAVPFMGMLDFIWA